MFNSTHPVNTSHFPCKPKYNSWITMQIYIFYSKRPNINDLEILTYTLKHTLICSSTYISLFFTMNVPFYKMNDLPENHKIAKHKREQNYIRYEKLKKNRREVTFFRCARTKGGGMGYFVLFCPVSHCRKALNVRYLLYYTHNIAQSPLWRLWRAANVSDRQTQSTPTNNTTRPKHS